MTGRVIGLIVGLSGGIYLLYRLFHPFVVTEPIIGLIVGIGLGVYLLYTLIHPEKF